MGTAYPHNSQNQRSLVSWRIGTINATSAGGPASRQSGLPREPRRYGAVEGSKARVGVKRARWPPVILRRRGLAVKARVQGGESEASRA